MMGDQKAALDRAIEAFKQYKSGKAKAGKRKPTTEGASSGSTSKGTPTKR